MRVFQCMGNLAVLAALVPVVASAGAYNIGNAINPEKLKPTGERYEATVPDTLDLAERAKLSVHGLTSFLNPKAFQNPDAVYGPYGHTYFNGNPRICRICPVVRPIGARSPKA